MELIYLLIIAILSLFVILKSASYAITAIANYARATGISDYVIGFLVISIGTSLPELTTAITSSWIKQSGLILGNIIGANIIDVSLILGLMAVIAKKINVKGEIIRETIPTIIIMVLLPIILGFDGTLSRIDGIILLIAYSIYITLLIKKEGQIGHVKKQVKFKTIILDMTIFVIALIALLLSVRWLVFSSVLISNILHIPIFIFGLLFVAICTTTPELTVGIKSILKGRANLGFGDILGAVVTNLSLVLGVASLINPIIIDRFNFLTASSFMVFGIFFTVYLIKKKEVNWKHGIAALLIYIIFILFEVIRYLI